MGIIYEQHIYIIFREKEKGNTMGAASVFVAIIIVN